MIVRSASMWGGRCVRRPQMDQQPPRKWTASAEEAEGGNKIELDYMEMSLGLL